VRLRALRSTKRRETCAAPPAAKKAEAVAGKGTGPKKRSMTPVFAVIPLVIIIGAVAISKRGGSEKSTETVAGGSAQAAPAPSINIDGAFAKIAADGKLQVSNAPVHLSRDLVTISPRTQIAFLNEEFEKRLKGLTLPEGAMLALRPEKDFVGTLANDFQLMPAMSFDLNAIRSQVERVIAEEEKSVKERETELKELTEKEKELVTTPQSEEELKREERLKILKQAVPEDLKEIEELRKKAALVPKDIRQSGSFSLFLCQKDETKEIARFDEEPELVRVVSP